MATKKRRPGDTYYSKDVPGDSRNWKWPVRFDYTDGYIGIAMTIGARPSERVLLTPKQFDELVKFVEHERSVRARLKAFEGEQ